MAGNVVAWVYANYPVVSALDRNRKVVLSEVAESANRDFTQAHPGVAKLADHWGFDPGTVRRHLAALVEDKWLEVLEQGGGRGKATVYRVCEERGAQRTGLAEEENSRNPENARTEEPIRAQSDDDTRAIPDFSPSLTPSNSPLENTQTASPVHEVFQAWKDATGRNGSTKLTPERKKLILAALKDYPPEDVMDAVRGWQHSPFHAGQNEQRKVYNDINHCLKNGSRIEEFRDLERGRTDLGTAFDPAVDAIKRLREMERR